MRLLINKLTYLFVLLLLVGAHDLSAQPELEPVVDKSLWLTEQYPPYHFQKEGKVVGIGIDILKAIFKDNQLNIDISKKVLVYPWARAVRELSINPNAIVISMSHTEERARKFKLTEPLFYEYISLISLADSNISLDAPDSIANHIIGTVRGDIGEKLVLELTELPLKIAHVQTSEELLQLLLKKRVNVIAYSKDIIDYQIRTLGLSKDDFKVLKVMREMPSTIAMHIDGDPALFNFLNENIKQLREAGTLDKLTEQFNQE